MNRLIVTRAKKFILREVAPVDTNGSTIAICTQLFDSAQQIIDHVAHHWGVGTVIEWKVKP